MLSAVKGRYNTVPLFTHPATDEIERVLEPFASEADRYEPSEDDEDELAWLSKFTVGHLRAARNFLLKFKGGRPLAQKSERG
jgi:hypothetical protein